MVSQLPDENLDNVLNFNRHKTAKTFGPLRKCASVGVLKALKLHCELPLRESEYLFTLHTDAETVICAHLVQCAFFTLGHDGAVHNANFIRKLFGALVAVGEGSYGSQWKRAVGDLAQIDAHSAAMALSTHYNVSDKTKSGVVKKAMRAFSRCSEGDATKMARGKAE